MLAYVLNQYGKPLMPCKAVKARILLKAHKAKVIRREPFTIQLLYGSSGYKQPVTLGVDAGSKHNRPARFDNRKKPEGWLAPSVLNRINAHLSVIARVCKILPVSKIIVETASFDIQKINNPEISGVEYQQGAQLGFWNVREYVLFRDGHMCQHCKGKTGDKVLNVHHIESRKIGGDAPNNLITLCETCHKAYHAGKFELTHKRGVKFNNATFMGIMRWALLDKLKEIYPYVRNTYGYLTKCSRLRLGLPKTHYIDAYCIAG